MAPLHRRDRNVYILGAGFSALAGVPVVRDFLHRARETYDDPNSPLPLALYRKYKKVFEFRSAIRKARDVIRQDLNDIEVLFSLIDMHAFIARDWSDASENVRHLIANTVELFNRPTKQARLLIERKDLSSLRGRKVLKQDEVVAESVRPNERWMQCDMGMYDALVGVLSGAFEPQDSKSDDVLITFNYDLVIERALAHWGLSPDYCANDLKRGSGDKSSRTIPLLKLHGSCNWAKKRGKGRYAHYYADYATVPDKHDLLIVPPSWKKDAGAVVLEDVWRKAFKAISLATRICIIGYSLPEVDAYFKYLLTSALSENPGLYKLLVVDIDTNLDTGPCKRYRSLFEPLDHYGRFEYYHSDGNCKGVTAFLSGKKFQSLNRGTAVGAASMLE